MENTLEKKLLLLSVFSGLYLALLLSGVLTRFDSVAWVGGIRELVTIPAIIAQIVLCIYSIRFIFSKRRSKIYPLLTLGIFLVLLGLRILYS